VPYGHPKNVHFPEGALHTFRELLARTTLKCGNFKETMQEATEGDVIYCDPPYVPLTLSASFTSYAKGGFSLTAQQELVDCAKSAAAKGATVIISNHDTELTRELYKDSKIEPLLVRRSVGSKGNSRIMTKELIACYTPQERFAG
jgi:DNA adenine methylase